MCGRFAQHQGMADYLRELNSKQEVISSYDNLPIERYNVAPHSTVQLLHAAGGGLTIAVVRWGGPRTTRRRGKCRRLAMPAPKQWRAEVLPADMAAPRAGRR